MQKTAIVSGGSSGIGLAIVKSFESAGYRVFNFDIQSSKSGNFIPCDLTDPKAVQTAVESIQTEHTIDVLVSNAGVHFSGNIEATSMSDFERVMATNVNSAFYLTKAVIPGMRKQNKGLVLYIGSDQSTIGKANSFVYNISKHALASMAKTMALDYAQFNIRANTICPGTIETPLFHKAIDAYCERSGEDKQKVKAEEAAMQPLNRLGTPEDVAALAVFLASEQASFITGSLYAVDGGYTAA